MAKGKKANRLMNRLILKNLGKIYLNAHDFRLSYFAQEVERRTNYSSRTILKAYRARSVRLREAAKEVVNKGKSTAVAANEYCIKMCDLELACKQYREELT